MHTCTCWQKEKMGKNINESNESKNSCTLWVLRSCQGDHIRSSGPAETLTSLPTSFKMSVSELSSSQSRFDSTANFEARFYCTAGCILKSQCEKYSEMLLVCSKYCTIYFWDTFIHYYYYCNEMIKFDATSLHCTFVMWQLQLQVTLQIENALH